MIDLGNPIKTREESIQVLHDMSGDDVGAFILFNELMNSFNISSIMSVGNCVDMELERKYLIFQDGIVIGEWS